MRSPWSKETTGKMNNNKQQKKKCIKHHKLKMKKQKATNLIKKTSKNNAKFAVLSTKMCLSVNRVTI